MATKIDSHIPMAIQIDYGYSMSIKIDFDHLGASLRFKMVQNGAQNKFNHHQIWLGGIRQPNLF
jgi:hypothetical protein